MYRAKAEKMSRRQVQCRQVLLMDALKQFKRICELFTFFSKVGFDSTEECPLLDCTQKRKKNCAKNVANYPSELGAFPSHFSRRMSLCPFRITFVAQKVFTSLVFNKKKPHIKVSLLLEKNIYVSKLQKLSSVSPLSNLFQRPLCSKGKSGLFPFKIRAKKQQKNPIESQYQGNSNQYSRASHDKKASCCWVVWFSLHVFGG